ncbi:MAG: hypothetical protein QNK20_01560 [Aureibaculum sp.]|nr:hypothetical protein [Aureibaculum sp.]
MKQNCVIYNDYPPQVYGNLKTLCKAKGVSHNTYKVKKFPFKINGIEVFKDKIRKGERKTKIKRINNGMDKI